MPTSAGRTLLAAGALSLAGGYLLGYPQLDVLGCAALLAVLVAVVTVAWRPVLTLRRELDPAHVTRGEAATCALTVRGAGRFPAPSVTVHDRLGDHRVPVRVPALRPGGAVTLAYRLDTTRRGVFEAGPLRWERRDALGLAAVSRTAGEARRLCVHPVTHPMAIAASGRTRSPEGPADRVIADGAAFHRLREYVPGDDLRRVHWASSARTGTLVIRESLGTSLPATTVLLDTSRDAYAGGDCFEEAVEVAASALLAAVRQGFPARCVTGRSTLEARGDARAVLDHLAALTLGPGPGLSGMASALPPRWTGAALIAVTGRVDDGDLAALRRIAPRHDRTALVALRPPAAAPSVPAAAPGGALVISATAAGEACALWNATVRRWS